MRGILKELGTFIVVLAWTVPAAALESPWAKSYESRARLLAGLASKEAGPAKSVAGIEIQMPVGWKTYWRSPGEAGGVPPSFDWSGSQNLASATVLYPAPQRLTDASGDTIGYADQVVFPVEFMPVDPAAPTRLSAVIAYGICKEICVPVETTLELDVPARLSEAAPTQLTASLGDVPRASADRRDSDPRLDTVQVVRSGAAARVVISAVYPGGAAGGDLFVEGPADVFIPAAKLDGVPSGDRASFVIDLPDTGTLTQLSGRTLTATLVGPRGASVASFAID